MHTHRTLRNAQAPAARACDHRSAVQSCADKASYRQLLHVSRAARPLPRKWKRAAVTVVRTAALAAAGGKGYDSLRDALSCCCAEPDVVGGLSPFAETAGIMIAHAHAHVGFSPG